MVVYFFVVVELLFVMCSFEEFFVFLFSLLIFLFVILLFLLVFLFMVLFLFFVLLFLFVVLVMSHFFVLRVFLSVVISRTCKTLRIQRQTCQQNTCKQD